MKKLEKLMAYCPRCHKDKAFEIQDKGIARISLYRCRECKELVAESYFQELAYQKCLRKQKGGENGLEEKEEKS